MIQLFLQPNDISALTGFSGNIDADTMKPSINVAQNTHLKRILGVDLYNKISTDLANDTLAGDYLDIYDDYVVYITAFFSASIYLSLNTSKVSNIGVVKMAPENSSSTPTNEVNILSKNYEGVAISFENQFYAFMMTITIPEYGSDEQNKEITNFIPWY